ncbi:MAG: hybrid sensor histidine kinase/response regulator [Ghiorsea sp.]
MSERVETLFRKNEMGLPGTVVLIAAFLYAYRDAIFSFEIWVWVALVASIAISQWFYIRSFFKTSNGLHSVHAAQRLSVFSFLLAMAIGNSIWAFLDIQNSEQVFFVSILLIGPTFGSIIFAASYFPIHVVWSVPLVTPIVMLLIGSGNAEQNILGYLIGLATIPSSLMLGWIMSQEYMKSLGFRFEKDTLLSSLQLQKDAADKANKDKTHFLAAASHDLRQPHQALGLFVEALDHMETNPQKKEILSKTKQAFQAMSGLLNQLLDISKLDTNTTKVSIQAIKLQPLLHQVVMEHMGEAEQKNIELRLRPTQAVVLADAAMLVRILSNLLTNAIRYTKKGGVFVSVRNRKESFRLDVWDTGCGMPKESIHYVFQEFTQLNNAERDREKGLGLGLAIVQRLAHLMRTEISVISEQGKGSRFSIALPYANEADIIGNATQRAADDLSIQGLRIVIVDDDKIVLDSLKTLLEVWGCETWVFLTQDDCVAHLQHTGLCPDAIISDFRLRDQKSGVAVVDAVRTACGKVIPALIITGDTAPEHIKETQNSGLPLLHKPVNPDQLLSFLNQVAASD